MSKHQSPQKASAASQSLKSMAQLPSPDINNAKENITLQSITSLKAIANDKSASRKPRSKSIGPGGLDALRENAGNRRQVGPCRAHNDWLLVTNAWKKQSALPPSVKSILKATIPLSPPKRIPPHASSQRASPSKTQNAVLWKTSNPISGSNGLPNSFEISNSLMNSTSNLLSPPESETKVAVRSEAEQQATAKERERQEALAHKDARRKSLGWSKKTPYSFNEELHLNYSAVANICSESTGFICSRGYVTYLGRRRASRGLNYFLYVPEFDPTSVCLISCCSVALSTTELTDDKLRRFGTTFHPPRER